MLGVDYYGISVIVAAVFAGIASIISALNNRSLSNIRQNTSTNGDPRTAGQMLTDVANQVGATAEKSPISSEASDVTAPPETPTPTT